MEIIGIGLIGAFIVFMLYNEVESIDPENTYFVAEDEDFTSDTITIEQARNLLWWLVIEEREDKGELQCTVTMRDHIAGQITSEARKIIHESGERYYITQADTYFISELLERYGVKVTSDDTMHHIIYPSAEYLKAKREYIDQHRHPINK